MSFLGCLFVTSFQRHLQLHGLWRGTTGTVPHARRETDMPGQQIKLWNDNTMFVLDEAL